MAEELPTNTPFRRLHHPNVLHMFQNSWGEDTTNITTQEEGTDNLSVSVWLPVLLNSCLTLHLARMIFLSIADKYNDCSLVFLTCMSFSLASHYCCSVRVHG